MNEMRTRIKVAPDGTITGRAPGGVPPGEHEASIFVRSPYVPRAIPADAAARVKALQQIVASLPILDSRSPDEILGYDKDGLFG